MRRDLLVRQPPSQSAATSLALRVTTRQSRGRATELAAAVPIGLEIPGRGSLLIEHLLFDSNGTVSDRGELIETVTPRLRRLSNELTIHLLTADTFGTGGAIAELLGAHFVRVTTGEDKRDRTISGRTDALQSAMG